MNHSKADGNVNRTGNKIVLYEQARRVSLVFYICKCSWLMRKIVNKRVHDLFFGTHHMHWLIHERIWTQTKDKSAKITSLCVTDFCWNIAKLF